MLSHRSNILLLSFTIFLFNTLIPNISKAQLQLNQDITKQISNYLLVQYGIEPEDENHIHSFYKNRYFESAWFKIDGQLNDNALALINYAQNHEYANQLISKDLDNLLYEYTKQQPSHLLNKTSLLGAIEIRLSKLFLKTAIVNLNGLVKPEDIAGIAWNITPRYVNLPQMMDKALHLENISGELNGLLPQNKAYYTLKEYLKTYKYIATQGGWPTVPETAIKLELGDTSEVVKVLKARLIITQDLDAIHFNGLVYNDAVLEGVKHFQQRHGLHTDGVIGKNTLQNLNISVEERIRQIQLNLERFKWLPDLSNRGDKYIWVNIPHYKLKLFNQGQLLTEQNVVTGAKRSQTPCFDSYITDIVINPYWNVPYSIAKDEIAPKVSEDTQYLLEKNYEVINGWGTNRVMDSVGHLDWKDKSLHRNYRFRQKPGPGNALGVLKFNLPNPWSIYLHDTPSKSTFLREKRAYSHGCIRVQNPDQLATLLFNGQQGLDEEKLSEKINSRKTQTILLKDHVNVFIVYMTSGIDENGKLQLFEDVYGRDAKIDERLRSLLM